MKINIFVEVCYDEINNAQRDNWKTLIFYGLLEKNTIENHQKITFYKIIHLVLKRA